MKEIRSGRECCACEQLKRLFGRLEKKKKLDGVVTCIRLTLGGSTLESRSRISGHNQGTQSRIVVKDKKNIARGTTDLGYRVYNLVHFRR